MSDGPKILTFDIETSPHLGWFFGTRQVNITPIQIKSPTRIISWAAKWHGADRLYFRSEFHDGHPEMIRGLHSMLDEADVVVTYNGDGFDIPHFERERHLLGLPQVKPFVSVDLYKVIKKNEVWASHKLAYITDRLGLSGKLDNDGWRLWLACLGEYGPDEQIKAWRLMRRYNKRDVVTTEEVFDEYRPVIKTIPGHRLYVEIEDYDEADRPNCHHCSCPDVIRRGWKRTKSRRYRQYQCKGCGGYFSDTRSELGMRTTA